MNTTWIIIICATVAAVAGAYIDARYKAREQKRRERENEVERRRPTKSIFTIVNHPNGDMTFSGAITHGDWFDAFMAMPAHERQYAMADHKDADHLLRALALVFKNIPKKEVSK